MAKSTYGIIGHPIGHSLSPAMHNAAFKELGIDAEYLVYDVEPAALDLFLKEAASKKLSGFNVTIPHKIKTKEYLERNGNLNETASRLGAVNTVKISGNRLSGFNSDGPGFYRSLIEDLMFEPEGKNILILGAGGAASAIAMYLGNGPKRISISDVDEEKALELKRHYEKYYDKERLAIVRPVELKDNLQEIQLFVNATPIGMSDVDPSPIDKTFLRPGLYVYDLVYNRPLTRLVREARMVKCHAVTGLGMLLCQGAIAFEIWTGKKAPVDVMRKALKEALRKMANG